jgi:proteasome-associated ATPase
MASDRELLEQARATIAELQEVLERLEKAPHTFSTVIHLYDGEQGPRAVLNDGGKHLDVEAPKKPKVTPGDTVLVDMQSGNILSIAHLPLTGEPSAVQLIRGNGMVDVSVGGSVKTVLAGKVKDLREGDQVILDSSKTIVLGKLASNKERFEVTAGTGICWADIGGQEHAKQAMIEAIELPLRNSGLYQAYGKRETKGILLFGPPGCGKTLLGKAAVTAISELTGGESAFMYVKGPEILDPYVGVAEQTIRQIFQKAREHKERHGAPAVIFLDEADAILGRRGQLYAQMEKTIVPMFLTEMDGMEASGALVIIATNRPDTLDPAIVRDGRMDRKISVERPSKDDAKNIFALYLKKIPLDPTVSLKVMAGFGADELFSTSHVIPTTLEDREVNLPLAALASGALIAGIVDKAVSHALRRDMEAKAKKPSGVTMGDMVSAIEQSAHESRGVDHTDAIIEFVQKVKGSADYAEAAE